MARLIPSTRIPIADENGFMVPIWYDYFSARGRSAENGEVVAGGGLSGGGFVADGIALDIEANGVTNAMLRDSVGCSVIGRVQNTTGDPQDIQATASGRFLQRDGNDLVFRVPKVPSYTVAEATAASVAADLGAGTIIFVSNESGGAVLAFSDGTDFRRVTDRAVVS